MNARIAMRIIYGLLFAACMQKSLVFADASSSEKPDILFILVDDLRWDAMSYKGHPYVKTPNIDKLREGGASMENAFCVRTSF